MKKIFGFILLMSLFSSQHATAQVDPHFSQYYIYPSWLNPALTGAFDGTYRVAAVYRNQWNSVTSPFSTVGASADFTTDKNISFGVNLLSQKAGNGGYSYTTGYASMSYSGVRFGTQGSQHIVFGLQAGLINRHINPDKFQYGDQWTAITGYSPSNNTSDYITNKSSSMFDMGAGVLYYDGNEAHKAKVFAGFSASHLTRPQDSFLGTGNDAKLPIRYTGHLGVKLTLSEQLSITPNALYLQQGNAKEKMVGAYATLKANDITDILFGANYRFKDAVAPFVGFNYKNLVLGLSYDVNTSDLGKAVNSTNSFEISLSYIGRKSYKSTEHHFICPRL